MGVPSCRPRVRAAICSSVFIVFVAAFVPWASAQSPGAVAHAVTAAPASGSVGGSLTGTVTDGERSAPPAGTTVACVRVGHDGTIDLAAPLAGTVAAGADGSWRFDDLPAGTYLVVAHAKERIAETAGPFDVDRERRKDGIALALRTATALEVQVTGERDAPLRGARVVPLDTRLLPGARAADGGTTDVRGRARVVQFDLGAADLAVIAPGYAPAIRRGIAVGPTADAPKGQLVVVPLVRGGAIEARAVRKDGAGEAGLLVRLRNEDGIDVTLLHQVAALLGGTYTPWTTGDGGTVRIEGVAPGTYEVEVSRGDRPVARGNATVSTGDVARLHLDLR